MGPTPPPVKQPSAVDLLKSTLPAWMLGTEPEPELEAQSHNPQHSFPLLEARPEQSAIAAPPSSRSLPRRSAVDELRKAIGLHNGNFLDDVKYVSQPPPTDLGNGELGRRKRPLDDDQDVMPKRRKTARASSSVPMTERLRDTLARHPVNHDKSAELAEIPVAQLEALEFEIFKLESRVSDLTSINTKLRYHTGPVEKELALVRLSSGRAPWRHHSPPLR